MLAVVVVVQQQVRLADLVAAEAVSAVVALLLMADQTQVAVVVALPKARILATVVQESLL
jgi:hypothetical protein